MADLARQTPHAGVDYPKTFGQFPDWLSTDEDGFEYLARLRWSDGFACPIVRSDLVRDVAEERRSALGLQRVLGLGSYKTAWACMHKLRRAIVRPTAR